jgi:Kdo2-lipid IVA lauroyltransferase/acyltransferase
MFFIILVPSGCAKFMGSLFGLAVFLLARGERRKTLQSIRTAYPQSLTDTQVRQLALKVWSGLGRNIFETIHWLKWSGPEIASQVIQGKGWENLDRALARGKGVLVASAHLGNWELMAGCLASRYQVSAVAQSLYDSRFDEIVTNFREKNLKVSMIKRGMALRGILQALKENRLLIALLDQDTGKDGVFVPFFGKQAWTQSGIARIAQKTGAALVPVFVLRGANGRFEIHVEKEIKLPRTGDTEKDILETVKRYTEVIENYVKTYPDQWMWMHERWKTRPPGEDK